MIDYVEIRDLDFQLIGIIDVAKSIIWKSVYYGVGEFEIYCSAEYQYLLQPNYYVTRPNNREVGIIESLEVTEEIEEGRMIVASGRFAKSLFDRRIIYKSTYVEGEGLNYIRRFEPYVLSGNVEIAIRTLVDNCLGSKAEEVRRISQIKLDDLDVTGLTDVIQVEEEGKLVNAQKQVTYDNLLEYSDVLLQEYQMSSYLYLDKSIYKLRFKIYRGTDRSINQSDNVQLIFSREFDNLSSSNYQFNSKNLKTCAYLGGEGEGIERKCSYVTDYQSGLNRRETFIDVNGISSTYKDENGEEKSYTNEVYRKMLEAEGRQQLAEYQIVETLEGDIDLTNSPLVYGVDFELGDVITIWDNAKYINARILTVTEVEDDDGYKVEIEYGM